MPVSVIMATYNNAREIGLAVASILLQDYEDLELVIVNDASTDATPKILKRFAAQDDRVVVLHNGRNLGRAVSRNRAIETARSDLIAILDADDIAMPSRLGHQVAYMQRYPEVGMLGSWAIKIDMNNCLLELLVGPTRDVDLRRKFRWLRMPFCHSTVMFRRRVLNSVGKYDPRFIRSQDSHLCRRVIQQTGAASLPEFLVLHRMNTSPSPEFQHLKNRWSMYAGWDSLKQNPSLIGSFNFIRLFLLSCLPASTSAAFSSMLSRMYRRNRKSPSAKHEAEVREWIRKLEEKNARSVAGLGL